MMFDDDDLLSWLPGRSQDVPIQATEDDSGPVIPMSRWVISSNDGSLIKTYSFHRLGDKNRFVKALLDHEVATQHSPKLFIDEGVVTVSYMTKDVEKVTEIDKESARFCDAVFKDIVRGA